MQVGRSGQVAYHPAPYQLQMRAWIGPRCDSAGFLRYGRMHDTGKLVACTAGGARFPVEALLPCRAVVLWPQR